MKKVIYLFFFAIAILSMTTTVLAGSIPEDLLNEDSAQIFFAEVVYYHPDKENPDIEVSPVKVIKGDVNMGGKLTYYNPNTIGDFKVKEGNVYLFTYFDENNPTDIFEVTSYDTSALKLKNVDGDMWKRFEKYLNEGRYLDADHARLDKQNEGLPVEGDPISLKELLGVAKEDAEKINIHYAGEVHEIDIDKFYKAIDGITLTDIENMPLERKDGDQFVIPSGMFITINGFDGYAFITDDCKVDKYGLHYSRLPEAAYTIKFVDKAKITALFAADEYKLPPLESPYARYIVYGVLLGAIVVGGVGATVGYLIKKKKLK